MVLRELARRTCRLIDRREDGEEDDSPDRVRPYGRLAEQRSALGTDDPDTLRDARTEARASLNKRIEAIEEKDDKAMSTVRLNLILLGVSVTVASSVPASLRFANWLTIGGLGLLVLSTLTGIRAYMYTSYTPGITADYLAELESEEYADVEWLRWMNDRYADWLRTATETESLEADRLGRTHFLQVGAVLLLVVGAVAGMYGMKPAGVVPSSEQLNETLSTEDDATSEKQRSSARTGPKSPFQGGRAFTPSGLAQVSYADSTNG